MTTPQSSVTHKDMANAIRALSMDAIQECKSGHPGLPLGAADVATVLFTRFLKFDPKNPTWADRDRFVLSAGHGSMLLYSLGYLLGYPRQTIDQIKRFRRLGSTTPGHPEYSLIDGIEATTGPLGQGIAMAVGMALAERKLREKFGAELVDHYTYVLAGDGCLMEGVSYEATALAGHLKLNKLIVLFDDNGISIDGPTSLATSEHQVKRFEAAGWNVLKADGHNPDEVASRIAIAQKSPDKPTIIMCKTVIGYGAPKKAGTAAAHGGALGEDEVAGVRKAIGWDHPRFVVPDEILNAWRKAGSRGASVREAWEKRFNASNRRQELKDQLECKLPEGWEQVALRYKKEFVAAQPSEPTRTSAQKLLGYLVEAIPHILGGSADLTASNLTKPANGVSIRPDDVAGNYVHYGIREHGMAAIMNGIALHGGFIPYGGTFLVFSDYCRPAIRISALMEQRVIYVLTHDTITQGPDGPTHQSVEQLIALRAMPNLYFFRPADGAEVAESFELALKRTEGPSVICLTREAVPAVTKAFSAENRTAKGAYEFAPAEGGKAKVNILTTGSEVWVAMGARDILQKQGIPTRVVSMPCWDLFEQQPAEWRKKMLGDGLRVSVESASVVGWDRWVGDDGLIIGMTTFGKSGMPDELMDDFGFTPEKVAATIKARLG